MFTATAPVGTSYLYDINDRRIAKQNPTAATNANGTFYLRNAYGREIAVSDINGNNKKNTFYVFGHNRFARFELQKIGTVDPIKDVRTRPAQQGDTLLTKITLQDIANRFEAGGRYDTLTPAQAALGSQHDEVQQRLQDIDWADARNQSLLRAIHQWLLTLNTQAAKNTIAFNTPKPDTIGDIKWQNQSAGIYLTLRQVRDSLRKNPAATYKVLGTQIITQPGQKITFASLSATPNITTTISELVLSGTSVILHVLQGPVIISQPPQYALKNLTFYIHDHLGNTRLTYNPTSSCSTNTVVTYTLESVLDYYPYGKTLRSYTPVLEKYCYTHNERDIETGYDYIGLRQYNSDVARWLGVDALSNKFPCISPFIYAGNNPIRNIDIGGLIQYPADRAKEYAEKYPLFTKYLQENLKNDVTQSKTLVNSLLKYSNGGLTRENIESDMTFGNGPTIVFKNLDQLGQTEDGHYYKQDNGVHTLEINEKLIAEFEKAAQNPKASDKAKLALLLGGVSTLLHEYVHYGDRDNDYGGEGASGIEEGHAFEAEVYGQPIDIRNANSFDIRTVLKLINLLTKGKYDSNDKDEEEQKDKINPTVLPTLPRK